MTEFYAKLNQLSTIYCVNYLHFECLLDSNDYNVYMVNGCMCAYSTTTLTLPFLAHCSRNT